MTKEELKAELERIEMAETNSILDKAWDEEFSKMLGKCYKTRNSYSIGRGWFLYKRITRLERGDLYLGGIDSKTALARCRCLTFEKTCNVEIKITPYNYDYCHNLGEEISEEEFLEEFNKIKKEIERL